MLLIGGVKPKVGEIKPKFVETNLKLKRQTSCGILPEFVKIILNLGKLPSRTWTWLNRPQFDGLDLTLDKKNSI